MFSTVRVRWKLLARDPLKTEQMLGIHGGLCKDYTELTEAQGCWQLLEGVV